MKTITEKLFDLVKERIDTILNYPVPEKLNKKLIEKVSNYLEWINENINYLSKNQIKFDETFVLTTIFNSLAYLNSVSYNILKSLNEQDEINLFKNELIIRNSNQNLFKFIFDNQVKFLEFEDLLSRQLTVNLLIEQEEEATLASSPEIEPEFSSIDFGDLLGEPEEFTARELSAKTEELAKYAKELELKGLTFADLIDINSLLLDKVISEFRILLGILQKLTSYFVSFKKQTIIEMIIELVSVSLDHLIKIKEEKIAYPVLSDESKIFIKNSLSLVKSIYSFLSTLIYDAQREELEKKIIDFINKNKILEQSKGEKKEIKIDFDETKYVDASRQVSALISDIAKLNGEINNNKKITVEDVQLYTDRIIKIYNILSNSLEIAKEFIDIDESEQIDIEDLVKSYSVIFDTTELAKIITVGDLIKSLEDKASKFGLEPRYIKGLYILYKKGIFPDFIELINHLMVSKILRNKEEIMRQFEKQIESDIVNFLYDLPDELKINLEEIVDNIGKFVNFELEIQSSIIGFYSGWHALVVLKNMKAKMEEISRAWEILFNNLNKYIEKILSEDFDLTYKNGLFRFVQNSSKCNAGFWFQVRHNFKGDSLRNLLKLLNIPENILTDDALELIQKEIDIVFGIPLLLNYLINKDNQDSINNCLKDGAQVLNSRFSQILKIRIKEIPDEVLELWKIGKFAFSKEDFDAIIDDILTETAKKISCPKSLLRYFDFIYSNKYKSLIDVKTKLEEFIAFIKSTKNYSQILQKHLQQILDSGENINLFFFLENIILEQQIKFNFVGTPNTQAVNNFHNALIIMTTPAGFPSSSTIAQQLPQKQKFKLKSILNYIYIPRPLATFVFGYFLPLVATPFVAMMSLMGYAPHQIMANIIARITGDERHHLVKVFKDAVESRY